jgi:hypothetical protein
MMIAPSTSGKPEKLVIFDFDRAQTFNVSGLSKEQDQMLVEEQQRIDKMADAIVSATSMTYCRKSDSDPAARKIRLPELERSSPINSLISIYMQDKCIRVGACVLHSLTCQFPC